MNHLSSRRAAALLGGLIFVLTLAFDSALAFQTVNYGQKRKPTSVFRTLGLDGPSGIVRLPSARISTFLATYAENGDTVKHFALAGSGLEIGALKRPGDDWVRHVKLGLVSEKTASRRRGGRKQASDEDRPGLAVGFYGSGSDTDERTYFLAASQTLTDAGLTMHWGLTRPRSLGGTAPYYGVDYIFNTTFRLLGEFDSRSDVWNLGLEYMVSYNLTAFHYQLDVRDHAPSTVRDKDVTGVCYRTTF